MRGATSPRLLLELMCAQVLLPPSADSAGLADRLDRLERKLAGPQPDESGHAAPTASRADRPGSQTPAASQAPAGRTAGGGSAPAPRPALAHSAPAPPDADMLRARWPDVLEAVQARKRVAWMQLSHAAVDSFSDGVLTLAFAQPGVARGFMTGGYDKDLSQVLAAMFGSAPQVRTSLVTDGPPGGSIEDLEPETRPATTQSSVQPRRADGRRPADSGHGEAGNRTKPQRIQTASQPKGAPARPSSADAGPELSDPPSPDILTGTGLVERELGGRMIQELDGS